MVRHQLQQFFFFPNTPLESSEDQSGVAADFSGIPNCFSQTPMSAYCQNQEETNRTWDSIDLKETPFFFSAERNSLRVIGCGNAVLVTRSGVTLAGCSSFCQNTTNNFVGNGGCFGINCCQATIPSNLNFFRLNTTATSYLSSASPCTFAALGNGFSTDQASPQQSWASIELTWMIEEAVEGSRCQKNTLNGAEVGNYTYYNCSCLPYEEGNPYLPHACQVPEVCKNCAECRNYIFTFSIFLSDFGISRSVSLGQTHLTTLVQGTFGYLDPEYFVTNHFSEKVMYIKPIPSTRSEEERSLVAYFTSSLEQGRLFDIIDNRVMKEGGKDEILAVANLASRCLHFKGKERPTMKEVTKELEHFRTSFLPFSHVPQNIHKGESMVTEMMGPLDGTSTSTEWFKHDKKSSSYDV
ncbi:hypothetical protein AAG906_001228 [Vitis piasezkii]